MWRGRSTGDPIDRGARVRVRGVDGLVLRVEAEPGRTLRPSPGPAAPRPGCDGSVTDRRPGQAFRAADADTSSRWTRAPRSWWDLAACRGHDASVFFAPAYFEKRAEKLAREALAKALCVRCPVREPCLEQALVDARPARRLGRDERGRAPRGAPPAPRGGGRGRRAARSLVGSAPCRSATPTSPPVCPSSASSCRPRPRRSPPTCPCVVHGGTAWVAGQIPMLDGDAGLARDRGRRRRARGRRGGRGARRAPGALGAPRPSSARSTRSSGSCR